jgi:hypothetical protein
MPLLLPALRQSHTDDTTQLGIDKVSNDKVHAMTPSFVVATTSTTYLP